MSVISITTDDDNFFPPKFELTRLLCFAGEIRCYCDAPHCVATGYMCKSELNACFTKVLDPLNTNSPLTHGCVDSLLNSADVCSSKNLDVSGGSSSPVECCHDDMCNYRGLHDLTHPRGDSTGEIHKCDKNVDCIICFFHVLKG